MQEERITEEQQTLFNNALYLTLAKLSQNKIKAYKVTPCGYLPQIIKVEDGQTDFEMAEKIIKQQHEDFAIAMDGLKKQSEFYEKLKKKIDNIIELNNDYKEMYEKYSNILDEESQKYNNLLKEKLKEYENNLSNKELKEKTENKIQEIKNKLNEIQKELKKIENKLDQNKEDIDFLNSEKDKLGQIIEIQKKEIDKFTKNKDPEMVEEYEINNKNCKLKRVDNFYYIDDIEDEGTETEIYNDIIEKNKNNTNVIFYRMVSTNHWRLLIQQGKKLMLIEPAADQNADIDYEPIKNQISGSSNNDCEIILIKNKIQYGSGCCELYSIALPFIINRYMIFNNIVDLNYVFGNNVSGNKFPSILEAGLSEQAWGNLGGSKNSNINSKQNVITERIGIITENIETLRNQPKINYNTNETFNDKFIKVLETEEQYLENLKENEYLQNISSTKEGKKILPENMKGGFFYIYRYILGIKVSKRYKDFVKEYFLQNLQKLTSLNIDNTNEKFFKKFFKKNFNILLDNFYKKFGINEQQVKNKKNKQLNDLDIVLQDGNTKISELRENLKKLENENDKITLLKEFFESSEENKQMDTFKKILEKENNSIFFKNKINDYITTIKNKLNTYFISEKNKQKTKAKQNIKPTNNKNETQIQKKIEFILDNILCPANLAEEDLSNVIKLLENVVNEILKDINNFNIDNLYNSLVNKNNYKLLIKTNINYIEKNNKKDKNIARNYLNTFETSILDKEFIEDLMLYNSVIPTKQGEYAKKIKLKVIKHKIEKVTEKVNLKDNNIIKNYLNNTKAEIEALVSLNNKNNKRPNNIRTEEIENFDDINQVLTNFINSNDTTNENEHFKRLQILAYSNNIIKQNNSVKNYLQQLIINNIQKEDLDKVEKTLLNIDNNPSNTNDIPFLKKIIIKSKIKNIIDKLNNDKKLNNNEKSNKVYLIKLNDKENILCKYFEIINDLLNDINKSIEDKKDNDLEFNFEKLKKTVNIINKIESMLPNLNETNKEYLSNDINLKDISNENLEVIDNLLENINNNNNNDLEDNFKILKKIIGITDKIRQNGNLTPNDKQTTNKSVDFSFLKKINGCLSILSLKDISNKDLDIIDSLLKNINDSLKKINSPKSNPEKENDDLKKEAQNTTNNINNNFKILAQIIINDKIKSISSSKKEGDVKNMYNQLEVNKYLTKLNQENILIEFLYNIIDSLRNIKNSINKTNDNDLKNNFKILAQTTIKNKIKLISSSGKDKNNNWIVSINDYLNALNLQDIQIEYLYSVTELLENIKQSIENSNVNDLENSFKTLKETIVKNKIELIFSSRKSGDIEQTYNQLKINEYLTKLDLKDISNKNLDIIYNSLRNINNSINKTNVDDLKNSFKTLKETIIKNKIELIFSSEKDENNKEVYDQLNIYLKETLNLKDCSIEDLDIINNSLENIKNSIKEQNVNDLKNNFKTLKETIIKNKIESISSSEKDENNKEIYDQLNIYLKETLNLKDCSIEDLDIINDSLENIKNSIKEQNVNDLKNNFEKLKTISNTLFSETMEKVEAEIGSINGQQIKE